MALLEAFLHRTVETGEALLISGEPGTGKTLLLDTAAEMADASGAIVLRARGVESEVDVGFSGLNQMTWTLIPHLRELDQTGRGALEVALGLETGPAPDLPLISATMLAFLRHARTSAPVLVVID